jgi:hypothetical protein
MKGDRNLWSARGAFTEISKVFKRVDACDVTIHPFELKGVIANRFDCHKFILSGYEYRENARRRFAVDEVQASGAGTILPQ